MNRKAAPEQILIHAPFGRDGALIREVLAWADLQGEVCPSLPHLETRILEGAAAAIIAEEALRPDAVKGLTETLSAQPPWSDFPLLIMTSDANASGGSRGRLRLIEPLGNVTLIERPLRTATLVSAIRSALRARRYQYQIRDYIDQRERDAKELQRVNSELEQFAYSASHDLQEPARMMSLYSQLLRRDYAGKLDATAEDYIRIVGEGAVRMGALVNDLLLYTRSAVDGPVSEAPVDANRALEVALANLHAAIERTGASIECGSLPNVRVHEAHLQQLFQNLIGNALKYSQKHQPRVQIRAERVDGEASWIFSVADNGIGIDPRYAEHIFGIFKRLHASSEYSGTGIGLAICRKIVERYGGRIWVESEVGKGATFFFSIPDMPVLAARQA